MVPPVTTVGLLGNPRQLGAVEISGARRVLHLTGWAWLVCVKVDAGGRPLTYGVFVRNGAIVDTRSNVSIDRCAEQAYQPLDVAYGR